MKTENIIGLGVLGVGGYFLYNQLTKDKETSSSFGGGSVGSAGSVGNVNAGYSSESGSNKTGNDGDTIIKIVSNSNLNDGETKKTSTTKNFVQTPSDKLFDPNSKGLAGGYYENGKLTHVADPIAQQTRIATDFEKSLNQTLYGITTKKETNIKKVSLSPIKLIGGLFSKK